MKHLFFFFTLFSLAITIFAQGNSGLGFNFQAVIRGLDGFVMPSKSIELRFSLMPGQQATQVSWVETHNVKTDVFGTFGVTVGKGVKAGGIAAEYKDVNFAAVHYWLKVEIKEGINYRELSYAALPSMPYAEVATNAVSSPVGSVLAFAGDASKVPAGWLLCDGSAISRSEYAALYGVIGTAWGFGNNSTTFNLPDYQGIFLRGVSGNSGKDEDANNRMPLKEGGNSGNNVGSYQEDAIRNITGKSNINDDNWQFTEGAFYIDQTRTVNGVSNSGSFSPLNFDASRVVPVGSDNRPKNVYVNYIIKY